jgi:hypothetical protein
LWQQLARSRTQFVPTLVTRVIRSESPDRLIARLNAGDVPGVRYVPERTRERWRHQVEEMKQEPPMDWAAIQRNELRNLAEMRRAGIPLLPGTDVGAPLIVPGFSLHDELAHLVKTAGLTTRQALEAATIGAARVVGMADSLGAIDAGKLADLVLLDANPLVDIANARRIRAVIANGRLLERASIQRLLADVERNATR